MWGSMGRARFHKITQLSCDKCDLPHRAKTFPHGTIIAWRKGIIVAQNPSQTRIIYLSLTGDAASIISACTPPRCLQNTDRAEFADVGKAAVVASERQIRFPERYQT